MAIIKTTGKEKYVTYLEPSKLKEFRPSCILTHLGSSFLGTKPISGWWGFTCKCKVWLERLV